LVTQAFDPSFCVQVPRSVYVAWQELEQASGPLRARLDDIMVQSNVIGPDGKKTVRKMVNSTHMKR
jgi:hypothetical protein